MNPMRQLVQEFEPKGISRGGILFLRATEAIDFVERCRRLGISIYGIDAFKLGETTTRPLLEESIEFQEPARSYEQADGFLREKGDKDLFFEVVAA